MSRGLEIRGAISKLRFRLIFEIIHNTFLAFIDLKPDWYPKQPRSLRISLIDHISYSETRCAGGLVQEMIKIPHCC